MLTKTLPSYLYSQYQDDDDLQALVDAYNTMAQQYVDWFVDVNLPNYTGIGSLVSDGLLDWVATGLYGFPRPVLPFGTTTIEGVINSFMLNALPINGQQITPPADVFATTDDVYRRCLTWLFFKGDGQQFSIPWLKRRVMRFLTLSDGQGLGIDQTYRISVTFGTDNQVNITLQNATLTFGAGALNTFPLNSRTINTGVFSIVHMTSFQMGPVFKAAVDAGVLELPFQYTWIVNI